MADSFFGFDTSLSVSLNVILLKKPSYLIYNNPKTARLPSASTPLKTQHFTIHSSITTFYLVFTCYITIWGNYDRLNCLFYHNKHKKRHSVGYTYYIYVFSHFYLSLVCFGGEFREKHVIGQIIAINYALASVSTECAPKIVHKTWYNVMKYVFFDCVFLVITLSHTCFRVNIYIVYVAFCNCICIQNFPNQFPVPLMG